MRLRHGVGAKGAEGASKSRRLIPGLILYAQVDGGFSVWDPMRNYWTEDAPDRPNAFLFTPEQVWTGNEHCKGLVDDWALWLRDRILDKASKEPRKRPMRRSK